MLNTCRTKHFISITIKIIVIKKIHDFGRATSKLNMFLVYESLINYIYI